MELGIRLSFVKTSVFRGGGWTRQSSPRYTTDFGGEIMELTRNDF
jgi:hypothetical protein